MPFIDEFKTLRVGAGIRVARVAREAGLSEDTVQRIEKHHNVSRVSCVAAIEALNRLYYDVKKTLVAAELITDYSRKGSNFTSEVSSTSPVQA